MEKSFCASETNAWERPLETNKQKNNFENLRKQNVSNFSLSFKIS